MPRQDYLGIDEGMSARLGQWIGQAIGEGIAQGTQGAFAALGREVAPLVEAVLEGLRQQLAATVAAAVPVEEVPIPDGMRLCEEPDCTEPALARNLCRRHYARKLYQERKARLGGGVVLVPRASPSDGGGTSVFDKKLAPVAPIIRRKRSDLPVVAEPLPLAAASNSPPASVTPLAAAAQTPPPGSGVSVESVARFFGLNKG